MSLYSSEQNLNLDLWRTDCYLKLHKCLRPLSHLGLTIFTILHSAILRMDLARKKREKIKIRKFFFKSKRWIRPRIKQFCCPFILQNWVWALPAGVDFIKPKCQNTNLASKTPKWLTKTTKWTTKMLKWATCCSIFVAKKMVFKKPKQFFGCFHANIKMLALYLLWNWPKEFFQKHSGESLW